MAEDKIGYEKYLPPVIDAQLLGGYDAIVVMRSRDKEMAFVMNCDMPDEGFAQTCAKLRKLVLE